MNLADHKKEMLFSELHSLLSSGLDFCRSFEMLIEGEKEKLSRALLERLYAAVVKGDALWRAMEREEVFPLLDSGVVRIGEETGKLSETLLFLSDYYHKKREQKRMITSAVSYPLIILATALAVVVFMILVVVPMFEQVYARMGGELPAVTRWIIQVSKAFPVYLAATVFPVLLGAGWVYLTWEQEGTRKTVSELILKIPVMNGVVKKNNQLKFCKLLTLLTESGIPLLDGIRILDGILTFYPYRNSLKGICAGLERGELFTGCMADYPRLYDRKLLTLLRVGEETNRLPQMLKKQGEELGVQLEYRFKFLGNLLEPVLILLVGAVVALILISMYLPMFRLSGIMA